MFGGPENQGHNLALTVVYSEFTRHRHAGLEPPPNTYEASCYQLDGNITSSYRLFADTDWLYTPCLHLSNLLLPTGGSIYNSWYNIVVPLLTSWHKLVLDR